MDLEGSQMKPSESLSACDSRGGQRALVTPPKASQPWAVAAQPAEAPRAGLGILGHSGR